MKKDNKKKNKTCAILHSITSFLFFITGIMQLMMNHKISIVYFSLTLCFLCIAYLYYKQYKKEDK